MVGIVVALTILVCYDIADDGRRAKVAAQLQRWGDRIQYSVFLCTATAEDLPGLLDAVTEILDADKDSFLHPAMRDLLGRTRRGRAVPAIHARTLLSRILTGWGAKVADSALLCNALDCEDAPGVMLVAVGGPAVGVVVCSEFSSMLFRPRVFGLGLPVRSRRQAN